LANMDQRLIAQGMSLLLVTRVKESARTAHFRGKVY
jgi:hypothetical protein